MSESIEALRRANPRAAAGYNEHVDATIHAVRERIASTAAAEPTVVTTFRRRKLVRASAAGAALAVAAAVAVFVTLGSPSSGPGIENAAAAVRKAATLSAASAKRSGTAVLRITRDGELWGGTTIRWHAGNLAISSDAPQRQGRAGSELLVVGGKMYGIDPSDGGWVVLGSTKSIDPGSGTTPGEYLAGVREDIGGVTLRRITGGMTGLTTRRLADGSTVYSDAVAAGLIARETGFKEGHAIRVLPFGYVAHDEAADPAAPLDTAVTVGPDGIVREIHVTWGTWSYAVTYRSLGATPALAAPANAKNPIRERLRAGKRAG